MAKAQINKQDTLASNSADRDTGPMPSSSASDASESPREVIPDLHADAIDAPSHPVVVANPEHRAQTEAIPASRVGELPGPSGTAEIHGRTQGVPFRDGDRDPEGWYSGQGGITGDRSRDMVPLSDDAVEAIEQRDEPLATNADRQLTADRKPSKADR